jgi:predicted dehydrogenase
MTRVAVVGVGVMGGRHARVVAGSGRARLVRVVDPDESAGRRVADLHGAAWTPELDVSDVDAVIVAAPTGVHQPIAEAVLDAGLPLLVEKPLTADVAATERLVDLARTRRVPLMCGFVDRFNPAFVALRSMLHEPPAHLVMVRHVPHYGRIQDSVGWDLLIHLADHAVLLHGDQPKTVRSLRGRHHPDSTDDDVFDALLEFGGGSGVLSVGKISQRRVWTIAAQTLDATIDADLIAGRVSVSGEVADLPRNAREPLAGQLDHFLDLVAGDADPEAERASILAAHQIVGAALS